MKNSTRLLVVFLLTLVWCGATLYATNTLEILPFSDFFEKYLVLTPFIVLLGILVIWALERKSKTPNAQRD